MAGMTSASSELSDHRLLANDLVLGDVERGLRTLYGRNTLELGVVLAQERHVRVEHEDRLAKVDRVLGGSGRQETLTAPGGRKHRAGTAPPNGLTDRCGDPGLIRLGLFVANPPGKFGSGG